MLEKHTGLTHSVHQREPEHSAEPGDDCRPRESDGDSPCSTTDLIEVVTAVHGVFVDLVARGCILAIVAHVETMLVYVHSLVRHHSCTAESQRVNNTVTQLTNGIKNHLILAIKILNKDHDSPLDISILLLLRDSSGSLYRENRQSKVS